MEDCRHLSRRFEADLVSAGERVVRVPPKMMAGARRSARTRGKSDPIDALAVARAALRESGLPVARLDGPAREVKLLGDYRENLIRERTAIQNRLRWRLHELAPGFDPPAGSLNRLVILGRIDKLLEADHGVVATLARAEVTRIHHLTAEANRLQAEIATRVAVIAPSLLGLPGCGALTAAKLVGETADITRFHSRDAYAMWTGAAPIPVWSANTQRFRLTPGREPSNQRRAASDRHHPDTNPPRRPTPHRQAPRSRQDQDRSPPHPQTPTRRRRLPNHAQRHPNPGRLT